MEKYKINPNFAGWILQSTTVTPTGELSSSVCFQHTSSIEMLELWNDRQEWKQKLATQNYPMIVHYSLMLVSTFVGGGFVVHNQTSVEELKFYANKDMEVVRSNLEEFSK